MSIFAKELLSKNLQKRKENGNLRSLCHKTNAIDLASNDYLGLARSQERQKELIYRLQQTEVPLCSSTGSRLLTGHNPLFEKLEKNIAAFHGSEEALILNTGYTAVLALLDTLASQEALLLFDIGLHASFWDGIRLTKAEAKPFYHLNLDHLETLLKKSKKHTYILVESIYSDGSLAQLVDIANLAEKYNSTLIVDEAHALGVFGPNGGGLIEELQLENKVFARLYPLGKAAGAFGCVIAGSSLLKSGLINFARPLIYSTALPPILLHSIGLAYEDLQKAADERKKLFSLIDFWKKNLEEQLGIQSCSMTQIQPLYLPGNEKARSAAQTLSLAGIDARAILAPTVKKGHEHLRICLHAYNTEEELDLCLQELKQCLQP